MDPELFAKLLGAGGFGGAMLFILYRVLMAVGERIVAALDRVVERLDAHTREDLASHADTARDVAAQVEAVRADVANVRRELQGYAGEVRGVLGSWEPTPPPQMVPLVTPRGTPIVTGEIPSTARVSTRVAPRRPRTEPDRGDGSSE